MRANLDIKRGLEQTTETSIAEASNAAELVFDLEVIEATAQHMLVGQSLSAERLTTDAKQIAEHLEDFRFRLGRARNATRLSLDRSTASGDLLKQAGESDELAMLDRLDAAFLVFESQMNRFIGLVESDPDAARDFLQTSVEPRLKGVILPLVLNYKQEAEAEVREDLHAIRTTIERDDRTLALTTLAAISIAVATGLLMARGISRPLRVLQQSTEKIGRGDLSGGIPIDRSDELGMLASAFEKMQSGLKETMVSRSYLDVVLNSMSNSLIAIDGDGRIQKVNQATLDLLDYSAVADLAGHSIGEVAGDRVGRAIAELLQTGNGSFCEATYVTRAGQAIAVDFSVSPLHDDRGDISGAVCIARNATERRRAEQALRESEERYALVARAANDGLWDWDLHSTEVYYSSRWKSMLGYAEDEVGSDPEEWFARIRRSDRERVRDAIDTYIEQTSSHFTEVAQMFELEYPMRHRNGSIMWMLCRGIAVRDERGAVC
ncbi:MAG: PAS domain S-box protein, partial [Cyanobacteria bacterium J06648_11]